jgi:hypothetical protein
MVDEREMARLIDAGWMAAAFGGIGRLIALSRDTRPILRWGLLWELPVAFGAGFCAAGACSYMGLGTVPSGAAMIVAGRMGPDVIDLAVAWLYRKAGKL